MTKVGIIGIGKWGKNHLRVFSELDCDLVGISDINNNEAEQIAKNHDILYKKDYHDLLPLVDAVSVVVPTDLHFEVVKDCLLSGKDVFVEKPLTLDSVHAAGLAHLAEKKKLTLAVGYLFMFNPAVIALKEELNNIEDLQYITMRYIHSTNPPRKDSGVIFNFASHLFSILNFVLEETPKNIRCEKINYLSEEREDAAVITLDYGDFIASLEVSWLHPLKRRDCWVIGSDAQIYVDFLEQNMRKHLIKVGLKSTTNRGFKNKVFAPNEPLKDELQHFLDCAESGETPINNGYAAYLVTEMCERALEVGE